MTVGGGRGERWEKGDALGRCLVRVLSADKVLRATCHGSKTP